MNAPIVNVPMTLEEAQAYYATRGVIPSRTPAYPSPQAMQVLREIGVSLDGVEHGMVKTRDPENGTHESVSVEGLENACATVRVAEHFGSREARRSQWEAEMTCAMWERICTENVSAQHPPL